MFDDTKCMYIFADVQLLLDLLLMVGRCTSCNGNIICDLDLSSKKGVAQRIVLCCDDPNVNGHIQATYRIQLELVVSFRFS